MKTSKILKSCMLIGVLSCGVMEIKAQPCTASFTFANQQNIFTFQNTSIGSSLAYLWVFGDGSSSSQQNPVHTYATTGTGSYTVTLIVSDTSGCSDTTFTIINVPNTNACTAQMSVPTWSVRAMPLAQSIA